ncbi:hypothetical protein SAMN05444817_101231 [Corynebacterium appendicis CIP 107643]|uniref:Uncharacterized protein n=1 Tax=Corynebacterium appendicis CIP 107643 TaxID=1161099 RepID=A0A1N7IPR4_9CORY|nr:hypothetical protein [Corynebacterium appendicis]WJY60022.1 hypothetical protein CAPP_00310 [Corynebacterium appendicis CIP 107643]SIS39075.1 hypothetical protein SAMN05444817_101231 [Corynebacterium appendicis CIP 107643]
MITTKTAMAVTVAAAEDGAAVDTQKAEEIVDAAVKFVGGTTIEQLHIVADSEALPALAVALATRENLPENLTLVEAGHELDNEFVVVSADFILAMAG